MAVWSTYSKGGRSLERFSGFVEGRISRFVRPIWVLFVSCAVCSLSNPNIYYICLNMGLKFESKFEFGREVLR